MENYVGKVVHIEQRRYESKFTWPKPNVDVFEVKYVIQLELNDGSSLWFYTPSILETITKAPAYKKEYTSNKFCSGGDSHLLLVNIGDMITVRGNVKREKTKYGIQLERVKLV